MFFFHSHCIYKHSYTKCCVHTHTAPIQMACSWWNIAIAAAAAIASPSKETNEENIMCIIERTYPIWYAAKCFMFVVQTWNFIQPYILYGAVYKTVWHASYIIHVSYQQQLSRAYWTNWIVCANLYSCDTRLLFSSHSPQSLSIAFVCLRRRQFDTQ